jgi:hypothetical protein
MGEHTHGRVRQVRRPERHSAILVAQIDNGAVYILRHRVARAKLGAVLNEQLPSRGVLVLEVPSIALPGVNHLAEKAGMRGVRRWQATSDMARTPIVSVQCETLTGEAPRRPCRR